MSIGSARRDIGEERAGPHGSIPGPRTAADAYRVSDDQIHRARLVVARNCDDPDDLRRLLDMLGLISAPPRPAPARRTLTSADGARADPGSIRCRAGVLCW